MAHERVAQPVPLTRRGMLRTAATGLVSLTAASRMLEAATRAPRSMQIGLVTYLWAKDWDLATILKNCESSGVLGVELRTQHAHGVDIEMGAAARRDVKKRFRDSPVTLLGPGTNWSFHFTDQDELKRNIENAKKSAVLSHDVGGTGVKVKPNALPKGVPVEQTIEQIGRSLNEVAEFSAELGQQIRVEVHGRDTQRLPIMKQIMDVADHPGVRVCWNSNPTDLDGQGLEHNFGLVKDRFGDTCHIRELNVGSYPYQKLIQLLVEMDYPGWVLLECRTKPDDTVAALKEQRAIFAQMISRAKR